MNRNIILTIALTALAVALFRIMPRWEGVWGITPIFSIALFSGSIFKSNKGMAFLLPVLALFFSDVLWQLIDGSGFYPGQFVNYILFVMITCIGFFINKNNVVNIGLASLAAPTAFFLLSNFSVWVSGGGLARPKNFAGLMQTYVDGLPFYFPWQLASTLFFSALLFGGMYLLSAHKKTTSSFSENAV
ncbi:DUF6580 family putative transport protein [Haoranjiania flava]|uniref:Uncharacterized protein n=1 Tax=Haoranjiania flava TaxID=1856322 RepID=A0AAE3INI6_9BACT|nr:DUF6580 family putative transport protein [Haoranjiania flava]MCU7693586.1 hypothetical protein [Haoranjiania flava]